MNVSFLSFVDIYIFILTQYIFISFKCLTPSSDALTNNYNNTGKTVLFLRQVDDFAVNVQDENTAKEVIQDINSKMTINVKQLGRLNRFNGMDVPQSKHFIKLSNRTYIEKVQKRHVWLHTESQPMHQFPIPMNADNSYQKRLEQAPIPTEEECKHLKKKWVLVIDKQ